MKKLSDVMKPIVIPTMSDAEWLEAKTRTDLEWKRVRLPAGWIEYDKKVPFEGLRAATRGKTSVMFSTGKQDGRWWLHVSVAHPERMPSYMDLSEVKEIFVGNDRQAVQVFPKAEEHVNIHSRALHLWCCLEPDGDGLPRFGKEGTI